MTCLLILSFFASPASAQDFTVSGTVTDASSGESLPGVNIQVVGTTIGTATGANGSYTLEVPSPNDSLRFSYLGYEPQTVPINGRSTIDISMETVTLTGNEVVVVGYSTQQKSDLTGSVDVVDVANLTEVPSAQVTEQLQGQASGVTVISSGQPGDEPMIRIRGINTFGNNEPLYVVDGVPTQNIATLNPKNIESLQVLKDAGAASIYGARASNGVVIITTKKGSGDVTVRYSASFGYQLPKSGNVWDILSPQGMADLTWMALRNSGDDLTHPQYGSGSEPELPNYIMPSGADEANEENYFVDPHYTNPTAVNDFIQIVRANKEGTNWYQEIHRTAPMTDNNLSVSGSNEQGNYFLSLGYLNQQGTLSRTYLRRYSLRANTSFNVNDNIRIGENLSFTVSENKLSGTLVEGSAIGMSFREQPIIPVYDIGGNFAGTQADGLGNAMNPVAIQYRTRNNDGQNKRLFGNTYLEIDLLNDLRFRSNFGGEIYSGYYHSFQYPTYENAENGTTNAFSENSYNGYNWTWSNTLTYTNTFADKHNVDLLAGAEAYYNYGREVGGTTQDFFSFDPNYTNLDTGSGNQTNYSFAYSDALFSLFGRIDYNYDRKYLLSLTLRRDGSSKFLNNRYGLFPAVTAGWRISEEPFMNGISWLTDLKLRGGYGVMGNQLNVDSNNPYTLFSGSPTLSYYDITGSNSDIALGFQQQRIGNPDAQWERDKNLNVGFDIAVFNGQLEATVDYYRKDIEDLLYNPELPATAGAAAPPFINVATMKNTGIDASLRGQTLIGELEFNTTLTFTSYNNEIVQIAEGIDYFDLESRRFNGSTIIRNAVGHPVSAFHGYNIIGFWDSADEISKANAQTEDGTYQEDAGVGRFRYQDVDGDGEITPDDRTFLGSPHADFTYGLNISLFYKNWDLSLFAYGSQGAEIWNQVKWWTDFYASFNGAKSNTALYDSWTPENQDAEVAIQENAGSFSTNQVPNSYYVEDGSYLRMKNIQLGYTLPSDLVGRIGIQQLRIYAQAANLFTITGYSGITPEIGSNDSGDTTGFGIDEGAYATPRQFLMGVNLTF